MNFLLSFYCHFFSFISLLKKKKELLQDFFLCCLGLPYFYCRIAFSSGLNCEQMEPPNEEQYSQERNPKAYMSMRDYRNHPWQQPVERNPNPNRPMRDYRDQWMSAPVYSVPSTYALPASPYYAPTSQQQQPLTSSPVEQAILNLSKLVDNFIEDHRVVNVQANQEIKTVESSLNKELDVVQSEIDQEFDIMQQSISHQEEENLKEECLTETILSEQAQLQPQEELKVEPIEAPEELQDAPESCAIYGPWRREEEILPLLTEEAMEECQYHNLPLPPSDSMCILPVAQPTPGAPTGKATSIALPVLQKFKKLVVTVQAFATTSKTMAAAHTA